MATTTIILRTNLQNKDGNSPLYVRINVGNQRAYRSLNIWIPKSRWNSTKELVKPTSTKNDLAPLYNQTIHTLKARASDIIAQANAENIIAEINQQPTQLITAEFIKNKMFNIVDKSTEKTLFAWYNIYIKNIRKNNQVALHNRQRTVRNKFYDFLEKEQLLVGGDIAFSKLDLPLVKKYINYLNTETKNSNNTIKQDLISLGNIYNAAIREEYIPLSLHPFNQVKLEADKIRKIPLYSNEVLAFRNLKLPPNSIQEKIRDMFMFQIYTAGLRVSDLFTVTSAAVINNGTTFYYEMRKTQTTKVLLFVDPARAIFEKYKPDNPDHSIFNFLEKEPSLYTDEFELAKQINRSTQFYNKELNKLAVKAGITKRLTSHIARHTFANMAISAGWPITTIQSALGHSGVTMTERYLKGFKDLRVDENLAKLFNS